MYTHIHPHVHKYIMRISPSQAEPSGAQMTHMCDAFRGPVCFG